LKRLRAAALAFALLFLCISGPIYDTSRAAGALLRLADPTATGPLTSLGRRDVLEEESAVGAGRARLYLPRGDARPSGVVLIHGVHRLGIEEPRLRRFAASIASAGVAVLTPEIEELARFSIDPGSIDTIGAAAAALRDRLGVRVGLMGVSFGGGLAVVTAADPRFADHVTFVASVGGHHDLATVLRFFADDPRAHDYGPLILVYEHLAAFFSEADVPAAREALRAWLWERHDDARALATKLSAEGRARLDLFFAHRVRELRPELLAVAASEASRTAAVSPSAHLHRLRAPLFVLHGDGDPVIPSSEARLLARDCPPGLLRHVLVTPAITHAELDRKVTFGERLALIRFMGGLLEAADDARP